MMYHRTPASVRLVVFRALWLSSICLSPCISYADDAGSDASTLNEVVVYATKRSEKLQDVPVSETVVDPSQLVEQNLTQARDYLTRVPGVAIQEGNTGTEQIVIRGISTGTGGNPLVGITLDDVPFGSSTFAGLGSTLIPDLDPGDLSQIEVLRGPQGTLYGASAMGGLIKYETSDPNLHTTGGRVEVDGSTTEHGGQGYGVRGSFSGPLVSDTLGVTLSAFRREDPGFIDDPVQHRTDVNSTFSEGGRVALLWDATDQFKVHLSALQQDKYAGASSMVDVNENGVPLYGDYDQVRLPGTDGYTSIVRFYDAKLDYDFGPVTLSSITGYINNYYNGIWDSTDQFQGLGEAIYGISDLGWRFQNLVENQKLSEELRLANTSQGPLKFLGGIFYTHEDSQLYQNIDPANPTTGVIDTVLPVMLHSQIPTTYRESALFGDVTYAFTSQFDLQVGGRWSHIDQTYEENDVGILASPATGGSNDSPFTYMVAPTFHLSTQTMIYARVSTGYRAGGPNPSVGAGIPLTYAPDRTVNYELGLKSEFMDHRLSVDASVFRINWHDIQVAEVDPVSGSTYFANAGTAHSQGLEAAVQYIPVEGLKISANGSYTEAVLDSGLPTDADSVAPSGSRLPYSPRWSGTLAADYERALTEQVRGFAGATVMYVGDRLGDFQSTLDAPRYDMPDYYELDLRLGARFDSWAGTLYARNLTDQRGVVGVRNLTSSPSGPYSIALIQPMTIGISLTRKF
jgi:outer membrane receptor protein involved in Fe transport